MKAPALTRRHWLKHLAALSALPAAAMGGPAQPRIRLGTCVPVGEFETVAQLGFDYVEPGAAEIAAMPADEFTRFKGKVLASPLRCEAFNSLIRRKDLLVVGPSVNLAPVLDYLDGTFDRCRQLGARCVVWGSAGSRNVPPGFSPERAWDQIAVFLQKVGPLAARYQLPFSIEPLNRAESNILTTAHEAWRMVQQVSHPNIQLMVDYYHFTIEKESLDIFETARGHITHLHFANPHGRVWPTPGESDSNYRPFFEELRRTQWSGGLSIEGTGTPEKDGASALEFLRANTR